MNKNIIRNTENPLLKPSDVVPSSKEFQVIGIFNCGVVRCLDETILLCRIAETVIHPEDENKVSIPVVVNKDGRNYFETVSLDKTKETALDFSDSRQITLKGNALKIIYLTSLSHFRIARSKDGVHFELDQKPTIMPNNKEEQWGIEDPRITPLGDRFYITYTAVSPNGAAVSLIETKDFTSFQRHGIIFLPENKDTAIFPGKINGTYYCMNRPVPAVIGSPDIWLSRSVDLIHWGRHTHLCGVSSTGWENGRIGGGAVPILTDKGWLVIYHAADKGNRYCLGVMLLAADAPEIILAKSKEPLVEPLADYEVNGFFGNVVFTCGCLLDGSTVIIYYGAADDSICRIDIELEVIYEHLEISFHE